MKFALPGKNLPGYAATLAGVFNRAQMAQYFGMVKCIDDNVGRILAALREEGALERTFIVFTSDHGDLCGEHGRDNKGVPMEASSRIPFLLHAPGVVKPGTIVRHALGNVDFKPTILALMGVANPTRDEGRDASALFRTGEPPAGWQDLAFIRIGGQRPGSSAGPGNAAEGNSWLGTFSRNYKFIVAPGAPPALFDLANDPDELHNVIAEPAQRGTVRQLARALHAYAGQYHDPLLASERVQADLAWAMSDQTGYNGPLESPPPGKTKRKRSLRNPAPR